MEFEQATSSSTPAGVQLIKATAAHKEVIDNLMQFYMYDFSEYLLFDVEHNGLFAAYPHLEDYWTDVNNRFPYIVVMGNKCAGFVLVRYIETAARNYFSIAEFFILKKYRRSGIGSAIAIEVFSLHRGQWQVYQKKSNKPARLFWKKVINSYTNGHFVNHLDNSREVQEFEN